MVATVTPTPRENPIENPREKPKKTPSNQAEAIRATYLITIKAMRSVAMTSQCIPKNVTKLSICVKFQCVKLQWVWVSMCKVTTSLRVNVPSYNEFICPCAQKILKYGSLLIIHLLIEAGEKFENLDKNSMQRARRKSEEWPGSRWSHFLYSRASVSVPSAPLVSALPPNLPEKISLSVLNLIYRSDLFPLSSLRLTERR